MMKKLLLILFMAALVLTGCSYKKPETHTMMGLNIQSITTVCNTDCTMSNIHTGSNKERGTVTYEYTDVANEQGISDAKKYHEYLKTVSSCIKIDDFEKTKGSYKAYFKVKDSINEGFLMKISFTKDSYTTYIEDNVNLEDIVKQ